VAWLCWLLVAGVLAPLARSQDAPPQPRSLPVVISSPEVEQFISQGSLTNFVVVLPQNAVYRIPAATANELDASPGDQLNTGDQLRTGLASRAALLGPSLAAGVAETSQVQVAGTDLVLRAGRVYGKTLGAVADPAWVEVLGARVRAAGTEYLIQADPSRGRLEAYVAAGRLELTDPSGTPVSILPGQVGFLGPDAATTVAAASGSFESRIGWKLHYPAIPNLDDLLATTGGPQLFALPGMSDSLAAYRSGDVIAALATYPADRLSGSPAETLYRANLLLVAGQVGAAENALLSVAAIGTAGSGGADVRLARALLRLANAVRRQPVPSEVPPALATEWLAESYYQQFLGTFQAARAAAARAVALAPGFGPALARLAELDLLRGKRKVGQRTLAEAISATPRHPQAVALQGFALAAERRATDARAKFVEAVRLDPRAGGGWLGMGTTLLCEGKLASALRFLQMAVLLEPQRAEFRTQLAKGYAAVSKDASALGELRMTARDARYRADEETQRARELDRGGDFRSLSFPSVCQITESGFYGAIAAGPAFVQTLDLDFSPELSLDNPCEPGRPIQFANGLRDEVGFDVGTRTDLGFGYRISRVFSLEAEGSFIWASAPNDVVAADLDEPGYNYRLTVSRGQVELIQVPLLAGVVARVPVSRRLSLYAGASGGVVFSWLQLGNLKLDCYNDAEYGISVVGEDSGSSWAPAYQLKAGLEYDLSEKLSLGLGYQFLGTTGTEWQLYGEDLSTDAVQTHAVSALLSLRL
jgi:opacity protein-like surface antigen